MRQARITKTEKEFCPADVQEHLRSENIRDYLSLLYDKAYSELGLQQSKRDQLITLYAGIFSFMVSLVASKENAGILFAATGLIGIILSLIVIRYRVYKEVYWLCCQCITVFFGFEPKQLTKENIQSVFYKALCKRAKGYLVHRDDCVIFRKFKYIKSNLFSAETLYFLLIALLTSVIMAISAYALFPAAWCLPAAIAVGLIILLLLLRKYFVECMKIYLVAHQNTDTNFNKVFQKAWFLHFWV